MPRGLVGLGNNGPEYDRTRHNAGFRLVEELAAREGASFKKFEGGRLAKLAGGYAFLPGGFMNGCGPAIRRFVDYFDIAPAGLLLVFDDVYVVPGSARLRTGGGDGGHNGLKSTVQALGTSEFARARIGVGPYPQGKDERTHSPDLADYALSRMPPHDEKKVGELLDLIAASVLPWLQNGEWPEATLTTN